MSASTQYPTLGIADPSRLSLASIPMEIYLQCIEAIFEPAQIIPIEIFGPENENPDASLSDRESTISYATNVVLHPPPLNMTSAAACRLFRYMYKKSRPTAWGSHLYLGISYHVDLKRDIFHVRINRKVSIDEFDWPHDEIRPDPLRGILSGIEKMATSVESIDPTWNHHGVSYLRHLNPRCRELMVLVPTKGVERALDGGLQLSPVLVPQKDWARLRLGVREFAPRQPDFWPSYRALISIDMNFPHEFYNMFVRTQEQRELWEETWRLAPLPAVEGYVVDERRLNDPNTAAWWVVLSD